MSMYCSAVRENNKTDDVACVCVQNVGTHQLNFNVWHKFHVEDHLWCWSLHSKQQLSAGEPRLSKPEGGKSGEIHYCMSILTMRLCIMNLSPRVTPSVPPTVTFWGVWWRMHDRDNLNCSVWYCYLVTAHSAMKMLEFFCPYTFCSPPAVVTRFDFLHHLKLKKELEDYLLDTKRHQTTGPLGGSSVDMLKAAMTLNARSPIFKSGKCSGAKLYGSNS